MLQFVVKCNRSFDAQCAWEMLSQPIKHIPVRGLERLLPEGLTQGKIMELSGPPSVGKTSFW
jgi:RecA/RadA recombinase